MNGRIIFRVLLALVVLAVVAGVGLTAYNAGVARGLAENVTLIQPGEGGAVPVLPYGPGYGYGYGGPFFHRGFIGFGPLGCLLPLLFFVLIFGLFKRPWGWGRGWRHGYGPGEKGAPPMFEEWHRRMHGEAPSEPKQT